MSQQIDPQKMTEKVRSDYNLIAREWDLSRSRPSQLKLDLVNEVEEGTELLDIGCGNGVMFPYVNEKGAYYFGLDIAENLIEIATERYTDKIGEGRAKFVVGDATDLPVRDDEFDFVISFAVLHHIPSEELRKKFFDEIQRALRPNGKVKITVWNLFNDWAHDRFDIGSQLAGKISGDVTIPWKGTEGQFINRFVHQFSKEELYVLAENAGFFDVRIDYFNRGGKKVENGEEMVLEMRG
ncbi:MAG: class I SAM-dependent methyltransferase [Candidatus Pacebacteria bacterium]|nr:class I SAM-dependent methyltransferase [Candidatus Paceibacterota bacterium]